MLQIVVEVDGTVCDVDCSIFSQTDDRRRPPMSRSINFVRLFSTNMATTSKPTKFRTVYFRHSGPQLKVRTEKYTK